MSQEITKISECSTAGVNRQINVHMVFISQFFISTCKRSMMLMKEIHYKIV